MKNLKKYLAYGLAFAILVSILKFIGISVFERSLMKGLEAMTFQSFSLFWLGGIAIGAMRDTFGILNMN